MRISRLRLKSRKGSLGMEALLILPFTVMVILLGRFIFDSVISRHEVAVHVRSSAISAAHFESLSLLTCTNDTEFSDREGTDKSHLVVCLQRDGEQGLSQERPILDAMKDRASAWTRIMRDHENEGPFDDIEANGGGTTSFDAPPFLEQQGTVLNTSSHLWPTREVFDHGAQPWKKAHDPVVWDELGSGGNGTQKLFPRLFPSRDD